MRSHVTTRLLGVLAVLMALALVAGACGSSDDNGDPSSEPSGPSGTLTFGSSSSPVTLDPHDSSTGTGGLTDINFVYPVYDTLIDNSNAGELVGSLATDWSIDGLDVTLTIRTGVTFTDGTEIDAEVVKTNLEYVRDNIAANTGTQRIASVTAPDATTVVVTLPKADAQFVNDLGGKIGMVVNPKSLGSDTLATTPDGSGPFVLDSAATSPGIKYVYTLRDGYWEPARQNVETLEMVVQTDVSARLNAVSTGEVDLTTLDVIAAGNVPSGVGVELVTTPRQFYGMIIRDRNGEVVPAFAEEKVRQAIAYAIQREDFVSAVVGEFGQASAQMVTEGNPGYNAELDAEFEYDPEKAKDLLESAGYADGFSFDAPAQASNQTFVEAISGFLEDVGITMNVKLLDPGSFGSVPTSTGYPVFLANFPNNVAQIGDLVVSPDGRLNPYKVESPELDALLAKANEQSDPDEYNKYLTEYQSGIIRQGIIVVAATSDSIAAHTSNVSNVEWGTYSPYPNFLKARVSS